MLNGDFNSIYAPLEKYGGSSKSKRKHRLFRNLIATAGLVDLGYHGPAYTWSNNRGADKVIMQRLDRSLTTVPWYAAFPEAKLYHLPKTNSDHCLILLRLQPQVKPVPRSFKFENWWLVRDEFRSICHEAINGGDMSWVGIVASVKKRVTKWAKKARGPSGALQDLEEQLLQVQCGPINADTMEQNSELQRAYNSYLLEIEAYWAQRSRIKWAYLGDLNTSFFHQSVTQRRRINRISSIQLEDDSVVTEEALIKKAFVAHYKNIYESSTPPRAAHGHRAFLQPSPQSPPLMQTSSQDPRRTRK